MAIGLGLLIGINFPRNFREPYLATDPREFWRRWHVTLSYFIRDYIYLKLGGNQAYVRNIIIIFVVAGLWHGAGWNFVLWGIYHAALVVAYHLVRPLWDPLPKGLRIALTFILVSLGWPLFYLSLDQYVDLMTIVFYKLDFASETFRFTHWAYLAAVVVWTFLQREDRWLYDNTRKHFADSGVLHAALISSAMLFLGFRQTFIYFRF
jgi:alginate O-acetyltransferase complex protein AlgI